MILLGLQLVSLGGENKAIYRWFGFWEIIKFESLSAAAYESFKFGSIPYILSKNKKFQLQVNCDKWSMVLEISVLWIDHLLATCLAPCSPFIGNIPKVAIITKEEFWYLVQNSKKIGMKLHFIPNQFWIIFLLQMMVGFSKWS